MTAPTPAPEKISAAELRAAFRTLTERIDQIESSLASLREGLTTAGTQPAANQQPGETIIIDVSILAVSYDDNGQVVYKAKGGQYSKWGMRVWPEVIPALGIDPARLKPGPNPVNLKVVALMGERGPRKVTGLA